MRTFTACFGIEGPLQTCGPELKTKLHDPFEPFSASYHVLVVNRVSEVIFINSFISYAQSSTTFGILSGLASPSEIWRRHEYDFFKNLFCEFIVVENNNGDKMFTSFFILHFAYVLNFLAYAFMDKVL